MDEPPKWTGTQARSKTYEERIAHANERFLWHSELYAKALAEGRPIDAKLEQRRMNHAARHRDDLILEQQWRKDNDILGS